MAKSEKRANPIQLKPGMTIGANAAEMDDEFLPAMLRPITPDQDGLSAPKRWGRFFERVPHRTELSVFVGINLHGVQSKNLGAQWSVECSDIQKD